jgi:magnesium transporter
VITILSWEASDGLKDGWAAADLPALLASPGRVLWVDFTAPAKEEIALLAEVFRFHPLAIEDCESRRQHPKVEDYEDYLFILTHGVHPESSTREFRTRQLSLFVGRSLIVSFHREASRSVQYTMDAVRRTPRVLGDGPGSILYHVLDYQVDQYLPVLDNFGKKMDELEDLVFGTLGTAVLQEVLRFKKALMRLRRISGHQRDTLARLVRREFAMIDQKTLFSLRDVFDHLVRVTDLADIYRDQVNSTIEVHLSIVSNRTNEIMRTLTVVSTLFIPLTFVAGLYGMNFEHMPELHWRYGYLFAWALMAAVAGGMYWIFRRRGIFGKPGR